MLALDPSLYQYLTSDPSLYQYLTSDPSLYQYTLYHTNSSLHWWIDGLQLHHEILHCHPLTGSDLTSSIETPWDKSTLHLQFNIPWQTKLLMMSSPIPQSQILLLLLLLLSSHSRYPQVLPGVLTWGTGHYLHKLVWASASFDLLHKVLDVSKSVGSSKF